MYADDTVIYYSASTFIDVQNVVQDDLEKITLWMFDNELVLNESKTKSMLFGSAQRLRDVPNFDIYLNCKKLEQVFSFKYLGVTLDCQLNWKEHVETISLKLSARLKLLSRIRSCLNSVAVRHIYNGIIQPLFDYCDVAWNKISEGCKHELHATFTKQSFTHYFTT